MTFFTMIWWHVSTVIQTVSVDCFCTVLYFNGMKYHEDDYSVPLKDS
jgi:hypothetical protein